MTEQRMQILAKGYAIVYSEKGFLIFSKYQEDSRQLLIEFKDLDFCGNNVEEVINSIKKKTEEHFGDRDVRCYPEGRETVKKLEEIALGNVKSYGHFDNE